MKSASLAYNSFDILRAQHLIPLSFLPIKYLPIF